MEFHLKFKSISSPIIIILCWIEVEASVGGLRSILPFTQNTHTYDVEIALFMYKKFMN